MLLLVVLVTATLGRLWTATVVAVVATGAYNYFFFPPVGTFTIDDPHNWVAVIAFLVAAVIASKLSAAAQASAQEAITRRHEVTRLFDLTRDVLSSSVSTACFRTSWTWRGSMPRPSMSNDNGSRQRMWSTRQPHTSGTRWTVTLWRSTPRPTRRWRSILLAQEFRCAADHHAGDEHRHDDENEHVDEADADVPEDVVQPHAEHRHQAAERRQRIVMNPTRTANVASPRSTNPTVSITLLWKPRRARTARR